MQKKAFAENGTHTILQKLKQKMFPKQYSHYRNKSLQKRSPFALRDETTKRTFTGVSFVTVGIVIKVQVSAIVNQK